VNGVEDGYVDAFLLPYAMEQHMKWSKNNVEAFLYPFLMAIGWCDVSFFRNDREQIMCQRFVHHDLLDLLDLPIQIHQGDGRGMQSVT
jgi:hypothetical protein